MRKPIVITPRGFDRIDGVLVSALVGSLLAILFI